MAVSVDRLMGRVARVERARQARAVVNSPERQLRRAERASARGQASMDEYALLHRENAAWMRAMYTPTVPALVALARLGADLWWAGFIAPTFPPDQQLPAAVAAELDERADFAQSALPAFLQYASPTTEKFRRWADARSEAALTVIALGGRQALGWRRALWVQIEGEWQLRPEVIAASERYMPARMREDDRSPFYWALGRKLTECGGRAPTGGDDVRYADIVDNAIELATQSGIPPAWTDQVTSGHPRAPEDIVQ